MSAPVDNKLKRICLRAVEKELEACEAEERQTFERVELNSTDLCDLSERIGALVPTDQSLLYFHYCFGFSDQKAGEILNESRPYAKRIYIEKVLSVFLGESGILPEGSRIGEKSMALACEKALVKYTAYDPLECSEFPVYSKKIRRRLKKIRAAQRTGKRFPVFIRRAAIVLLVFSMGFTTAMVANAEFRENVVGWFVERFAEYTRFYNKALIRKGTSEIEEQLEAYYIGYIPKGFYEEQKYSGDAGRSWHYANEQEKRIVIKITTENAMLSLDTEGVELKTMILKGETAFYWKKNSKYYIIWQADAFYFNVIADLNYDEVIKIAENILK